MVQLSATHTEKHTPVLVNSKDVEPGVLVFFRAKHGDLVVDKHPVQALVWNRPWRKTVRKKMGLKQTIISLYMDNSD